VATSAAARQQRRRPVIAIRAQVAGTGASRSVKIISNPSGDTPAQSRAVSED
jgi:hypothetical protein